MEAFGRTAPATGFAVDVDAVAGCLPPRELPKVGLLVHFERGELARAWKAVDDRAAGTCELSPCETLEQTLELAREKGADRVLVLADGNITRDMQHPTYNEILEVFAGDDDIDDVSKYAASTAVPTVTEDSQA